jgi:hypothetical protein
MEQKKVSKKKGCLITSLVVIVIIAAIGITLGSLLSDYENNSPSSKSLSTDPTTETGQATIYDEIKGLSDEQKEKMANILEECGIIGITSLTYDEGLEGMFTYSEETGYGKEDGYRINTEYLNNITLYIEDGEVLGIRYADRNIYENGEYKQKLTDFILTDKERIAIISEAEEYVKSSLKSPSTSKFPSQLLKSEDWKVWKEDGAIFVQSYVDAQNSFGAEIRSQFQLKVIDNVVVSYILDGTEMIEQ